MRLNPEHGALLVGFAEEHDLELTWATLWGPHLANALIGPYIGLPRLPGVDFAPDDQDLVAEHGQAWKFDYVEQWAGSRPLAWLDDEFEAEHVFRDLFLRRRQDADAPTLLVDVSPATGLTVQHFDQVEEWLRGL